MAEFNFIRCPEYETSTSSYEFLQVRSVMDSMLSLLAGVNEVKHGKTTIPIDITMRL